MSNIEQLKAQLSTTQALRSIAGAYSDISAMRIETLRAAFWRNSVYFEQISQIYQSVKASAIVLKPKTLHVALTSNKRFYGNLNRDVMQEFQEQNERMSDDALVIGLTGKEYLQSIQTHKPAKYSVFEDDQPTEEESDALFANFEEYDRIFLYYPRFVNMLTQTIQRTDISYSPRTPLEPQNTIHYIFEPELSKILAFFKTQIRRILFNRVLLETELSRTATRLVVMDGAEKKAEEQALITKQYIRNALQSNTNRSLIETIVWQKMKK